MNEIINVRHSPYMGKWQVVGEPSQSLEEIITPQANRDIVPVGELGQFAPEPIVVFEMS